MVLAGAETRTEALHRLAWIDRLGSIQADHADLHAADRPRCLPKIVCIHQRLFRYDERFLDTWRCHKKIRSAGLAIQIPTIITTIATIRLRMLISRWQISLIALAYFTAYSVGRV